MKSDQLYESPVEISIRVSISRGPLAAFGCADTAECGNNSPLGGQWRPQCSMLD